VAVVYDFKCGILRNLRDGESDLHPPSVGVVAVPDEFKDGHDLATDELRADCPDQASSGTESAPTK
jgi:hypothetical protein